MKNFFKYILLGSLTAVVLFQVSEAVAAEEQKSKVGVTVDTELVQRMAKEDGSDPKNNIPKKGSGVVNGNTDSELRFGFVPNLKFQFAKNSIDSHTIEVTTRSEDIGLEGSTPTSRPYFKVLDYREEAKKKKGWTVNLAIDNKTTLPKGFELNLTVQTGLKPGMNKSDSAIIFSRSSKTPTNTNEIIAGENLLLNNSNYSIELLKLGKDSPEKTWIYLGRTSLSTTSSNPMITVTKAAFQEYAAEHKADASNLVIPLTWTLYEGPTS